MSFSYFTAYAALITGLFFSAAPLSALTIVRNGRPSSVIVISDTPSASAKKAALTLREYLAKMSGARLEIKNEKDAGSGTRILVGRMKTVQSLGVTVPSGFTKEMNEEGMVIKTAGGCLVLAGNEDWQYRGTEIAVNRFLESLGCRWFFPGAYGEVVPPRKTVEVGEIDRIERPSFRFRNIWYSGWMPVSPEDGRDFAKWYDLNNMSMLPKNLPADGSVINLAPPDKYYQSHPEIYAMDKSGNRVKDMLCMTEPEGVKIGAETIREYFRNNPDEVTYGFAPPDGHPMCYCARCLAAVPNFRGKGWGDPSLSDIWFGFANAVAKEVYKDFPDKWILTNGYANRMSFPEGIGPLSPNLGIQSANIAACTLHPMGDPKCWQRQLYRELLDRWTENLDCVFIYDYDPGKGIDGMPFPALHNLKRDFPYFKSRGVWGFWTEANNSWMVTHLNYYIRAKLMWNADEDVDALVRDYCEKFYGAAAGPVEEYIMTLENAVEETTIHETWGQLLLWKKILAEPVLLRLDALMAEAVKSASTPETKLHTRVLDLVHRNMKAYVAMENAADSGDFPQAISWVDTMFAIRGEVAKIRPSLLPFTNDPYKDFPTAFEWQRTLYKGLADRTGGTSGTLAAMLPEQWEFRTDPEDIGVIYQWYRPGANAPWNVIDATSYWGPQGYQDEKGWGYTGKAWYRTGVRIPGDAASKPLRLTLGGVYGTELWVWANGMLVGHMRKGDEWTRWDGLDFDVTGKMDAGKLNTIAVLVDNTLPGDNIRGGIYRRAFLWSPR
jgi:hypothetical protein